MMNEAKSYKVCILDEQYALLSDESEERVLAIAQQVDSLMKDISQKSHGMSAKKIAVLTALQLASKLREMEEQLQASERVQSRLNSLLEQETF